MSQPPTFNMSMASMTQLYPNSCKETLGRRNCGSKSASPSNSSVSDQQAKKWVQTCRGMLIEMESKNIKTRAVFWSQFVNDITQNTMSKIQDLLRLANIAAVDYHPFQFMVNDPLRHLRFLSEWTGLKTQQMQFMPKSYTEFEYKAKNWLNGRKAPNYALTLFPEMIHHAESYAEQHSARVFSGHKMASSLLSTALRFGYLARLCSAKISLNDTGRKTPLLIENSIKTAKSTTSKIFQQYAMDHPYSCQFPTHTSEAASYFDQKYKECLQRLIMVVKEVKGEQTATAETLLHSVPPSINNMPAIESNTSMALPTNIMPTLPNLPLATVAMPSILPPSIPQLSADITVKEADTASASFNFGMGFTVSDIHSTNNKNMPPIVSATAGSLVSPESSHSTFSCSQFNLNSPSSSNCHNLLAPVPATVASSNNVLLPAQQYNHLLAQLNRLTDTQNEQKSTIHQLVARLQTLEQRLQIQAQCAQQQQEEKQQETQQQLWPAPVSSAPAGYSLAQDFADATTHTPTTTNSSESPPMLNHNYQLTRFGHMQPQQQQQPQEQADGDIDITDASIKDQDDLAHNVLSFPGGLMFADNQHDMHMFASNPYI